MAATAPEIAVRVIVAADKSSVELLAPPGPHRQAITPELCEASLRQAGVEVDTAVRTSVRELLQTPVAADQPLRGVVSRATAPEHGVDGYVEWLVESPLEEAHHHPQEVAAEPAALSYYDRCSFVMVKPGQAVAKIHPPTAGADGRDVTGKVLRAKAGREVNLKLDESLLCDGSGTLIAQAEGVLVRDGHTAAIRRVLEIQEYVDFSTGNIDFHGDVHVAKGVRDLFTVKATGNVEVAGLIEAATILAGNDLIARGGFAGRERGTARAGGSVRAKYLDNVQGEVMRDLFVDREIINCDVTVHGALVAPCGAVIGGRVAITGRAEVGMLGSAAGVETEIVLGSVPRLEPLSRRLHEFVTKMDEKRQALLAEQAQLNNLVGKRRATATDKERQTELMFELSNLTTLLAKAEPTLTNLRDRIEQQRTIDVTVARKVFPGVVLVVGQDRYRIASDVRGPVRIRREHGQIVLIRGDGPGTPLLQVADLHLAA